MSTNDRVDPVNRAYQIETREEALADGTPVYVASHPELRGCLGQGATIEAAHASLEEARSMYLQSLVDDGLPAPKPKGAFRPVILRFAARVRLRGVSNGSMSGRGAQRSLEALDTQVELVLG